MNFKLVDFPGRTQPEVHALVGTGAVAAATEDVGALPHSARGKEDFASKKQASTLGASAACVCAPIERPSKRAFGQPGERLLT